MPIKVTENWSGRRLSIQDPWTGTREFVVTGASTDLEALTAVDQTGTGLAIPQAEDEHDTAPLLLCNGPTVKERKGPDYWVITCNYSLDGSGGAEPLSRLAEMECKPVVRSAPTDVDLDNKPVMNSAGEPLRGGTREVVAVEFTIIKNFPYFDGSLISSYVNAVNANPVTILNQLTFTAEHLKCNSIYPTHKFTTKTKVYNMAFDFEGYLDDTLGLYPFQHRFLDAGQIGWYLDTDASVKRPARFSNGLGDVFGMDVRLDGTGKPLPGAFADIKVGEGNRTPTTPPKAVTYYKREFYLDTGVKVPADIANNSTQACFLYFKKCRVVDFGPLATLLATRSPLAPP